MLSIFRESYYYLDLFVGYSSPVLFYCLFKTGRISKFTWHFFWIGATVGLAWEIPIFVLSGESTSLPLVTWTRPLIAHYSVFMVSHTLWDGLLFVIGIRLVQRICRRPCFERFRWQELALLFVWGQVSELAVELSSTFNDGWTFVEYAWNPVIFLFNGHNTTWLMQVIWAAATVVYYLLILRLRRKTRSANDRSSPRTAHWGKHPGPRPPRDPSRRTGR